MNDLLIKLFDLMITIPTVLIALTFHEVAHGFVAYKLGDSTAKYMGRLSLNPLKHLDPIGALCMVLCGFGWARPVPVDMRQFKNPKVGMAICAMAGPLTNLILGFLGAFLYWAMIVFFPDIRYNFQLLSLLSIFGVLNIYLAIFNLIPLPPFDGSRILFALLPDRYYFGVMRYEKLIMIVMFFFLWSGFFTGVFEYVVDFIIRSVGALVIALIEGAVSLAL